MGDPGPLQAWSSSNSNKRRNGGQAQGPKQKRQKTTHARTPMTKTKGVGAFHAAMFEALSTVRKAVAKMEKLQQVPRRDPSSAASSP